MRRLTGFGIAFMAVFALVIPKCMSGEAEPAVTFSASGGVGIVSDIWHFTVVKDVRVSPPRALGLGVGYGPFRCAYDTRLFFSLEGLSFTVGTREAELKDYPFGTAKLRVNSAGGLVYASLSAPNRLSPFVRLGLGAARVDFEETYSSPRLKDVLMDYWAFTYGLGAGIRYAISPRLGISAFYEGIYIPGERRGRRSDGVPTGILSSWGGEWAGMRVHIRF
jgi:opacity protein-like surface antigen